MKYKVNNPAREFKIGYQDSITVRDCAHIELEPGELITLTTESGTELDILKKEWGYYATPSLNNRLPKFGLRSALVRSPDGRFFLVMIEDGKKKEFEKYLASENLEVVTWMDSNDSLENLRQKLK